VDGGGRKKSADGTTVEFYDGPSSVASLRTLNAAELPAGGSSFSA